MNLLLFNLRVDRTHTALGFTTDWINELAKHFDHITVLTMYKGEVAVASNVSVISAGLERGWSKPRRTVRFYRELFKVLRMRQYHCCFAHMMPLFLMLAGPILKLKGIPAALWYAHNHKPAILPFATAFADKALASTATAFPMQTSKLRVIGQGIDTERFRPGDPLSTQQLVIMTIGRLSAIKNIDLMLRAIARVHADQPDLELCFTIVGEPLTDADRTYVARCVQLADDLGIQDIVKWLPPVPFAQIDRVYRQGHLFMSANDNGLDKAILEAMASGVPVLAMHPAVAEPLGRFCARDEAEFVRGLAELCLMAADRRAAIAADLREYVIREHGLARLGLRIATELKDMVA